MPKTQVLVVEDEQDIAELFKYTREKSGDTSVDIVTSGDAALKAVSTGDPGVILLDLNLPV